MTDTIDVHKFLVQRGFKAYKRKGLSYLRPYILGEDLSGISVDAEDNPLTDMGMIAIDQSNFDSQWYVARKWFTNNFEEVLDD